MADRKLFVVGTGALALAFAVGLGLRGTVVAQQAAPTQSVGLSTTMTHTLDLGPEIEGMAGRRLRLRVLTLAPDGVIAVHNHRDRPTVEFVLSGSATEFRGAAERIVREGEAVLSDKDTTHWWRNTGTVPTVLVAADIFRPQ
jgi:mannose-6-phosphate isomerase-like protein (cupin superfamily)